MKKSNLIKLFSIFLVSVMVILFNTCVLAADNNTNGFSDLTPSINNTNTNNTNKNANSNTNSNTNSNSNKTNNTSNTNQNNKTNNSSIYNNNNLPKTGIEDSIPVALLVVVFGISAVYAYKKIKEYRNI